MHDEDNYTFIGKNKTIDLTVKENKILHLLIQNKGEVVTKEQLCRLLYNDIDYYLEECMKIKIFGLRKKLKGEVEIVTIRGVGYKIPMNNYRNKEIKYCPFCRQQIRKI